MAGFNDRNCYNLNLCCVIAFAFFVSFGTVSSQNSSTCTNISDGLPSCDFDGTTGDQTCDWESNPIPEKGKSKGGGKGKVEWKVASDNITTDNGNIIEANNNGSFVYLDVLSKTSKMDARARFRTQVKTPPPTFAICISFKYAAVTGATQKPKLNLFVRNKETGAGKPKEEKVATIKKETDGNWVDMSYETCIGNNFWIIFESKMVSKNTVVAIDDIVITQSNMSSCPIPNNPTPSNTIATQGNPASASATATATAISATPQAPGASQSSALNNSMTTETVDNNNSTNGENDNTTLSSTIPPVSTNSPHLSTLLSSSTSNSSSFLSSSSSKPKSSPLSISTTLIPSPGTSITSSNPSVLNNNTNNNTEFTDATTNIPTTNNSTIDDTTNNSNITTPSKNTQDPDQSTIPTQQPPQTGSGNAITTETTTSSQIGKSSEQSGGGGLSNGGKIAIAVVFTLLGVAILIIIIVFIKHKKKNKESSFPITDTTQTHGHISMKRLSI